MILLKVTKKQSFTLSVKDTVLEKPQGVKIDPPSPFRVILFFNTIFVSLFFVSFRFIFLT